MFLSEWREFPSAPYLAGKKKSMTALVSMLLKSHASLTCFRACFLPGRARDLSAPRYTQRDRKQEKLTHHTIGCISAKRDSSLLQSGRHHRSQYSDVVRSTVRKAVILHKKTTKKQQQQQQQNLYYVSRFEHKNIQYEPVQESGPPYVRSVIAYKSLDSKNAVC